MAKKITQKDFLNRFFNTFPEADIEILHYTAISLPAKVRCLKCGKVHEAKKASDLLKNNFCCLSLSREERIQQLCEKSQYMTFVKKASRTSVILHCNRCGNDLERSMQSCLQSIDACKYCEIRKKNNMLSLEQVQERIDEMFGNTIQLLTYNGQLENNTYKCLRCGLIFEQKHVCLEQSRGCPKCDRYQSKGETFIRNLLQEKQINFQEQVGVEDLPLQHFDFGVYDESNQLLGYIEVQGEQHFEEREIFRNPLEKIQERDERKRKYCRENNIPLYELIYKKGKFLNLEILPF